MPSGGGYRVSSSGYLSSKVTAYGLHSAGRRGFVVARAQAEQFEDLDAWRYWDGNDWTAKR